ncbi:MAG: HAD family phosphatase [Lachnospiraceae bacterium]|nr:HAD family phosphatase [Lachnospiraceae bacterium]
MDSGPGIKKETGEKEADMLKQVIFDIGNVLSDFQWAWVLEDCGFSKEVQEILANGIFCHPLWDEYDRGVMGDDAVTAAVRKNCAGYEKEFDLLYSRFQELVKERTYSAPLIRKLKEMGLHVYILSNYGETMYQANASRFAFLPEVDGAVFSYREKIMKPDAAIYQCLLERYSLKAEESLFLDDRMVNVEGARAVGIHAELADSYETIRDALKKYQIEIEIDCN